jgi:glutamate-ammonia-ligase adenylyltransferase
MVCQSHTPMAVNRQQSAGLPGELRDELTHSWEAFVQATSEAGFPVPKHTEFTCSLLRVWATSDFVSGACIRDPALLFGLLNSGDLLAGYGPLEYAAKLDRQLKGVRDERALARRLRQFRRREMLRIAWRDLAGWSALDEVLGDLSRLADACIDQSLEHLAGWELDNLSRRKNKPAPSMVVLAMGKLGAAELNFSSDIDLIFTYEEAASGWKRRGLDEEEFYTRIGRQLIQALDQQTDDGFVFRVDMRLRPYGDSGPLVPSFEALSEYYQLQGREWERYAMIKARPVAGPLKPSGRLMRMLHPFVYRRYLDFGAFESLRNLKDQIAREVERKGMQNNIKLGPGGIREIEFIAQAFQLVRGGRQPELQQRSVLAILDVLASLGHLPVYVTLQLTEAYIFLRQVENRLQAFADEQIHELPEDEIGRIRLAFAMGFNAWESFEKAIARHRRLVHEHFEQVFAAPHTESADASGNNGPDLAAVWFGDADPDEALATLRQAGYQNAEQTLRWLNSYRQGQVSRVLGKQGQQRFDQLMPLLLAAAGGDSQPSVTLQRVSDLVEAIAGRTAYLSLLVEYPMALSQLVQLCSASSWVTSLLTQNPVLLDELLDPRALYAPLDRGGLQGMLQLRLAGVPADDLEQQMDRLRQFRHAAVLQVAATDIMADLPVATVGDHLTMIAEVVLDQVLDLVWNYLTTRHGEPGYVLQGKQRPARFAIAAYGKLGGRELGYGSDLDIIFLHDSAGEEQKTAGPQVLDNTEFFTRLGQRIIHILNTFTSNGILYEADTRLRPNGSSGLLVSNLAAFSDYQRRSAWTWENQALVRARVVSGDADIARHFDRIRSGVLARPRERGKLGKDIVDMRQRMRDELDQSDEQQFDIKQGKGGIADIEFMIQYGALLWSNSCPDLLKYTDNRHLLQVLSDAGLVSEKQGAQLMAAYSLLRKRANHAALQEEAALLEASELKSERDNVIRIWQDLFDVDKLRKMKQA